jgi:hypothetical protein
MPYKDHALRHALPPLAASRRQGSRPAIFFTRHGKDSVRMVVPGMEGRRQADKLKWGLKLKLDVKKPVIGLAAHPREQEIVALFGDGALRGYKMGSGGLVPTYTLPGARAGKAGGLVAAAAAQRLPDPGREGSGQQQARGVAFMSCRRRPRALMS